MSRLRARLAGFTLLELLIALAIFAILATVTYGGLTQILKQRARVEVAAERLHELQLCYRLMQRDFSQAVERGVRDQYGDPLAPLTLGGDQAGLEFTRSGWHNPAQRARASLQRVRYGADQDRLLRHTWTVLDRAQETEPLEQLLIEGLQSMQVRLLDDNGRWWEQWPDPAAAGSATPPVLRAAEVRLELDGLGELRWLFRLAF